MHKQRRCSGFTILELMIVLAIIAMVATVCGLAAGSTLSDMRLNTAALGLKSDMNLARLRAVRENRSVLMVFHPGHGSYYDIRVDHNGNGKPDDNETPIRKIDMPEGINFSSVSFGFRRKWAKFDSRGLASGSAGRVVLRNTNGKQQDVVLALSGRIRIVRN